MSFATQQIELSMCNPQTGLPLTANVYTIEGVTEDGAPRLMSIGQLVMAICLQRASALEDQIIGVMDDINANTALLSLLTDLEGKLVAVDVNNNFNTEDTLVYNGVTMTYYEFLSKSEEQGGLGLSVPARHSSTTSSGTHYHWNYNEVQTVISLVEDKMDSLNTISQDTLIQLQSLTTKRDQTYDLVSNVLKSLNNVLVGNANNL
jgi:hypothetical protein